MTIDDMLNKYKGTKAKQDKLSIEDDEILNSICAKFEYWLGNLDDSNTMKERPCLLKAAYDSLADKLNVQLIADFCTTLIKYQSHNYFSYSGLFLSAMINRGFEQGHNDFKLYFGHLKLAPDLVGYKFTGEEKNLLKVNIKGDVGQQCASDSQYCSLVFDGSVGGLCGQYAYDSDFIFKERVGWAPGFSATSSKFIFHDFVESRAASHAKGCTFTFNADTGGWAGQDAKGCTFIFNGNAGDWSCMYAYDCNIYFNKDVKSGCFNAGNCKVFSPSKALLKKTRYWAKSSSTFFMLDGDDAIEVNMMGMI